jgi:hypothetical protein
MYGYVKKMKNGAIRVCTDEPDYSELPDKRHNWATSVYGDVKELLPHDAPTALGKHVTATYGSEFVAARIAVEQILDIRTTLRYLGVPVTGKTILFGDNCQDFIHFESWM